MPNLDPKNINGRLYAQLDHLLTQLETSEHVTLKERTAAMLIASRIQYIFMTLRKEKVSDDDDAGSAVRKYAGAFKNDPRRGKKIARASGRPEPEPDDISGLIGDDDDAA